MIAITSWFLLFVLFPKIHSFHPTSSRHVHIIDRNKYRFKNVVSRTPSQFTSSQNTTPPPSARAMSIITTTGSATTPLLMAFSPFSMNPSKSDNSNSIPVTIQTATIHVDTTSSSPTILDVASFRNNCTSPKQMIEKQMAKKESIDNPKKSILDGITAGLFAGFVVFGMNYAGSSSMSGNGAVSLFSMETLMSCATVSTVVGGLISINNLTGNRIYVYNEAEAINRLMVDFVGLLKSGDDIGFTAKIDIHRKRNAKDISCIMDMERYKGTNGVVACADCQLRNSQLGDDKEEENSSLSKRPRPTFTAKKRYGNLPSHFHMKNMLVDQGIRRQGVARKLISHIEAFAKQNTDAKLLTLEVDESNTAAVNLYESVGFTTGDTMGAKEYGAGAFMSSRRFMTKPL